MFIFLSKFLPLFVYPVGLACLLILAGLIFWKRKKLAKFFIIAALLILFLGGNRFCANLLAKTLEYQHPQLSDEVKEIDLIVVLGGGTEPLNNPRPITEINAAGDRVIYAAKLHQQFPDAKILLSGGDIDFLDQSASTPAQDMQKILLLMGIPQGNLILQDRSQNTYEDALYSCQMIKEKGYDQVILVTSAMHMPRSVKLFEKQGCQVMPAPTDYTITDITWEKTIHPNFEEFIINLVPSYTNLSLMTKSIKEYLGMFTYRLKGWL